MGADVKRRTTRLAERDIERTLVERVEAAGGLAYKFTSPGRRSVPDRIVVLKFWTPQFVELKAPGKDLTRAQTREHARIHAAGGITWVINSVEGVEAFMRAWGDYVIGLSAEEHAQKRERVLEG
jgi:hypothetical protein